MALMSRILMEASEKGKSTQKIVPGSTHFPFRRHSPQIAGSPSILRFLQKQFKTFIASSMQVLVLEFRQHAA